MMIWKQVIVLVYLCICICVFVLYQKVNAYTSPQHLRLEPCLSTEQSETIFLAPPPMRDRLVGLRGALAQTLPDQLHLFRRHMLD